MRAPFRFHFQLYWPWSIYNAGWSGWSKDITLSKNKSFEVQIAYWDTAELFNVDISIEFEGGDHAGPSIELAFLGLCLYLRIYDHRHWDYENGRWEVYDEVEHPIDES